MQTGRPGEDVRAVLQAGQRARRARRLAGLALAVLAAAGALAVLQASRAQGEGDRPRFRTEPVERGELAVVVTATGTVKARHTVEVGAEVTGRLVEVAVDFNDEVAVGQLLARIDPTTFEQDVSQSRARLSSARAALDGARVSAAEAATKLRRAEDLAKQGLVSPQDLDSLRTAAATAKVSVAAALAKVAESEAALQSSVTRLEKTTIRSPIKGIVLNRKVEPGQTLTAGFQTPVLFQLAADLAEMELTVAVDEADVGRIVEGQEATFTVDAFPNLTFPSRVASVRNVATVTANVVTYEAVLTTQNDDRRLRPGMTATVTIVAASVHDALLVPNEALRYSPPRPEAAGASKEGGFRLFGPPRMGGGTPSRRGAEKKGPNGEGRVWVLEGGQPVAHAIRRGETDGERTEVRDTDLQPGALVIVGDAPLGGAGGPP